MQIEIVEHANLQVSEHNLSNQDLLEGPSFIELEL